MTDMPHLTTAVVVPRDDHFLMVEEISDGRTVFNQPAGHVEPGESILDAARRETLEETGWEVRLEHLLGLYTYVSPANGVTYHRLCFVASPVANLNTALDKDIIAAHWLDLNAIEARHEQLRSPLVLECIRDYMDGRRFPLALIRAFPSALQS